MPATLTPQAFVAKWRKVARELVRLSDASGVRAAGGSLLPARTLTNLYNARPSWSDNAHKKLDAAVFAAYGWTAEPSTSSGPGVSDEEIAARLLAQSGARPPQLDGYTSCYISAELPLLSRYKRSGAHAGE